MHGQRIGKNAHSLSWVCMLYNVRVVYVSKLYLPPCYGCRPAATAPLYLPASENQEIGGDGLHGDICGMSSGAQHSTVAAAHGCKLNGISSVFQTSAVVALLNYLYCFSILNSVSGDRSRWGTRAPLFSGRITKKNYLHSERMVLFFRVSNQLEMIYTVYLSRKNVFVNIFGSHEV